jgi:hypothetical protein
MASEARENPLKNMFASRKRERGARSFCEAFSETWQSVHDGLRRTGAADDSFMAFSTSFDAS